MEFIGKLGLIGQFVGLLCLGLLAIIVIAYSWIYLMGWMSDRGWLND